MSALRWLAGLAVFSVVMLAARLLLGVDPTFAESFFLTIAVTLMLAVMES